MFNYNDNPKQKYVLGSPKSKILFFFFRTLPLCVCVNEKGIQSFDQESSREDLGVDGRTVLK
jgi:hypothetical protein